MTVLKRDLVRFFALFALVSGLCVPKAWGDDGKEVAVYVTSWADDVPDASLLTCINYAFAHVNDSFDGVTIDNPGRLYSILDLKKRYRKLKVVLSVGGWGSGNFSEMAADARKRRLFAWSCRRLVWDMGLDGIDIDWEYPTQDEAGISASPEDTDNFTRLLKDLRTILGPKRILSIATVSSAQYVNFRDVEKYIDYVNVMTYDMGQPPFHNAPLYRSDKVQNISVADAVAAHVDAGVPREKIVMGVPFYGRGIEGFPADVKNTDVHLVSNYFYNWDEEAKVPYLTDREGRFAYSYDDARSIGYKARYARNQGLRGVMCWSNDGDDEMATLLRAVYNGLNGVPADDGEESESGNLVEEQRGQAQSK